MRHQAQAAGIGMPQVAVFDSPAPNAFATGARRDHALVAVSTGLLQNMNRDEVEAVLGHEVSHVANGDMVTLALIQGVVNTFVIFLARAVGFFVDRVVLRNERGLGIGYWVTTIVAEILLAILASLIVFWFSRRREFGADAFAARVYGKDSMIGALRAIDRWVTRTQFEYSSQDALATMKISGRAGGVMSLFSTHPPIEARIAALEQL